MKRRDFLNFGVIAAAGGVVSSSSLVGCSKDVKNKSRGKTKNIIFLVSDGMSSGTLTMADLLLQRKTGNGSNWINLYRENRVSRALMDTASASSLVTDSAAASSAWGGGHRVKNGALNVGTDGTMYKPIFQKLKEAGKSVGCVTTCPITHATPAGFCVSKKSRGDQSVIAELYLPLHFDVMMGGGTQYFSQETRADGKDLFSVFAEEGYTVVRTKQEMNASTVDKPLLGVFHTDGLPYSVDQKEDEKLLETVPSLAELTKRAIDQLSKNPNGFALQVEGGKVDWASHANDTGAVLYDQIAFDEAVGVAIAFAEQRDDTLVIVTTDHGNSNPGLFGKNESFDLIQNYKHSNEWILRNIAKNDSPSKLIEQIHFAQGYAITDGEAREILSHYADQTNDGLYNNYKLPFRLLATIQQKYNGVGWAGTDHSADFVELAMFGQGRELLNPFIKNTDLHYLMLEATGVSVEAAVN